MKIVEDAIAPAGDETMGLARRSDYRMQIVLAQCAQSTALRYANAGCTRTVLIDLVR